MVEQKTKNIKLDKLNDAVFKAIFRSQEARGMISSFLSEITGISKEDFLNAYFVGGEIPIKWENEKRKISDVVVKLDDHLRIVIIEMNKHYAKRLFRKNFEYYASVLTEKTEVGLSNYHKVILININNFNRHQVKVPIQVFQLQDQLGNIDEDVGLTIYDIILDNLINPVYNKNIVLEKIGRFFKTDDLEELRELSKGDEELMSAFAKINTLTKGEDGAFYYDYDADREEELFFAKQEAREEGHREGHREGQKLLVQNMLKHGITYEQISNITELSVENIQRLLN